MTKKRFCTVSQQITTSFYGTVFALKVTQMKVGRLGEKSNDSKLLTALLVQSAVVLLLLGMVPDVGMVWVVVLVGVVLLVVVAMVVVVVVAVATDVADSVVVGVEGSFPTSSPPPSPLPHHPHAPGLHFPPGGQSLPCQGSLLCVEYPRPVSYTHLTLPTKA